MKTYGEVEILFYTFINWELQGSSSSSDHFTPPAKASERAPGTH
jgi:hypothetical protein